ALLPGRAPHQRRPRADRRGGGGVRGRDGRRAVRARVPHPRGRLHDADPADVRGPPHGHLHGDRDLPGALPRLSPGAPHVARERRHPRGLSVRSIPDRDAYRLVNATVPATLLTHVPPGAPVSSDGLALVDLAIRDARIAAVDAAGTATAGAAADG